MLEAGKTVWVLLSPSPLCVCVCVLCMFISPGFLLQAKHQPEVRKENYLSLQG